MYRNIACALDGSDWSRQALDVALHIARTEKEKLRAIFIEEMPRYPGAPSETNDERERLDMIFEKLKVEAVEAGKRQGVEGIAEKRAGHPARSLVHYVKETSVDLLARLLGAKRWEYRQIPRRLEPLPNLGNNLGDVAGAGSRQLVELLAFYVAET